MSRFFQTSYKQMISKTRQHIMKTKQNVLVEANAFDVRKKCYKHKYSIIAHVIFTNGEESMQMNWAVNWTQMGEDASSCEAYMIR